MEKVKQQEKHLADLAAVLPASGVVLVITHDYPDPDTLASAAAMELLLRRRYGLQGRIVSTGQVSRAENREMMKHFRYKIRSAAQAVSGKKQYPAIFVDTAPWAGNVTVPARVKPIVVIDHHPAYRRRAWGGVYVDVRTGAGATATIMHEYLQRASITPPVWMATIMAYAIATETLDLSREFEHADLEAYLNLIQRANLKVLGNIRHAPLPRAYFTHLKDAVDSARMCGRASWTHLNKVNNPEIVAEIADMLLRVERVTWTFCTAEMGDFLLVSLRSSQVGARCGRIIRRVMRKRGKGGGHQNMAAGSIDLAGLDVAGRMAVKDDVVAALLKAISPNGRNREAKAERAQMLVSEGTS